MVRGYGSRDASTDVATSTAPDEVHDFHHVATRKRLGIEFFPLAKDYPIVLDHYQAGIDAERGKQLGHGAIPRDLPWRAVHRQGDDPARFRSPNHTLKYSG
jgi:hypothetical protein